MIPATYELAGGRFVPLLTTVMVEGRDFTGCAFRLQVRDRWNGGQLRADLQTVTSAAAEGVRLVGVTQVGGKPVSELAIRVNESTMEGMPLAPADPDADVALVYDLQVTIGGLPRVFLRGPFLVLAGATQ